MAEPLSNTLADQRLSYTKAGLSRGDLKDCPVEQLEDWLKAAIDGGVAEPTAMTLSTVDQDHCPSSRTVLLKGIEDGCLHFFTNYESQKGTDLAGNPAASIVLFWKELERQICLRGRVERLPRETSQAYFNSRPYESRIGAWTSRQSQPIPNRQWLLDREAALKEKYPEEVPLPDFWGGYRFKPHRFEFWQGRPSRLHDRFAFIRNEDETWACHRLCP